MTLFWLILDNQVAEESLRNSIKKIDHLYLYAGPHSTVLNYLVLFGAAANVYTVTNYLTWRSISWCKKAVQQVTQHLYVCHLSDRSYFLKANSHVFKACRDVFIKEHHKVRFLCRIYSCFKPACHISEMPEQSPKNLKPQLLTWYLTTELSNKKWVSICNVPNSNTSVRYSVYVFLNIQSI